MSLKIAPNGLRKFEVSRVEQSDCNSNGHQRRWKRLVLNLGFEGNYPIVSLEE